MFRICKCEKFRRPPCSPVPFGFSRGLVFRDSPDAALRATRLAEYDWPGRQVAVRPATLLGGDFRATGLGTVQGTVLSETVLTSGCLRILPVDPIESVAGYIFDMQVATAPPPGENGGRIESFIGMHWCRSVFVNSV
eukprot:952750-Pyramimonas_sp.AAC.1